MSDPLNILREEAGDFLILREKFRREATERLRRTLRPHDIAIRGKRGNVLKRIATGLTTDRPAGQDERRVDEWLAQGGQVPDLEHMSESFGVVDTDGKLQKELRDLARDASALAESERVSHPLELSAMMPVPPELSPEDQYLWETRDEKAKAAAQRVAGSEGRSYGSHEQVLGGCAGGEDRAGATEVSGTATTTAKRPSLSALSEDIFNTYHTGDFNKPEPE